MVVDTVLVKVASRCNLNCGYCYVYNMGDDGWRQQPKRMTQETIEALVSSLVALARDQGAPFAVVLHGGEPLLLGRERLRVLLGSLRAALPRACSLAIQTNGVLLDDATIELCVENEVTISISLDGTAEVHDRARPDLRGRGTYERVLAALQRLQSTPERRRLLTGVLAVIDPSADPRDVYDALKATGAPSVDFLHRDGNHDRLPVGKAALISTEYGSWLAAMLERYLADADPPAVPLFDEMLKLVMLEERGPVSGSTAKPVGAILVVETDGTVQKNDTLKSAHPNADRYQTPISVFGDNLHAFTNSRHFVEHEASQLPNSAVCLSCPDFGPCGGGLPAHRWSAARGYDNSSVYCADQKLLIGAMRAHLQAWRRAA